MRKRFFFVVLAFLVGSISVVSVLEFLFFENEKMRLLDLRLETIASTLIASGLSVSLIENLESTDDLIHDLLGEERVDQIINIYNFEGQLLAQNFTGSEFPLGFNNKDRWSTESIKGRSVRVFNFQSGGIMIQVGMVLDPTLMSWWSTVNFRLAIFMFLILILLVLVAYYSSEVLFFPLRELTRDLRSMSVQLDRKIGQPLSGFVVGPQLKIFSRGNKKTKDEFELLCAEITGFLGKLEIYTRSFNAQTAILTHELKTPLTILRNYLSDLNLTCDLDQVRRFGSQALTEIDRLTKLINDFLQWSVLSSNPNQPDEIYAIKLREVAVKVVDDFNRLYKGRVELVVVSDVTVFALPDHVHQLLSNLLSNALKYSQDSVVCRVEKDKLLVLDKGAGIPDSVRESLGSPFNRGQEMEAGAFSSGLGLAWVNSLCEKYGWSLKIDSLSGGTSVSVQFFSN
jgi:signal transduction histidine kinase